MMAVILLNKTIELPLHELSFPLVKRILYGLLGEFKALSLPHSQDLGIVLVLFRHQFLEQEHVVRADAVLHPFLLELSDVMVHYRLIPFRYQVTRDTDLNHCALRDHFLELLFGVVAEVTDSLRVEAQDLFGLWHLPHNFPRMNAHSQPHIPPFHKKRDELRECSAGRVTREVQANNVVPPVVHLLDVLEQCGVDGVIFNVSIETYYEFHLHSILVLLTLFHNGVEEVNHPKIHT